MHPAKCMCLRCGESAWATYNTLWECKHCGHKYSCSNGIPRLYLDSDVALRDKKLRDEFYDGFLGAYYNYVMPFLTLPVRSLRAYWKGWLTYFGALLIVITSAIVFTRALCSAGLHNRVSNYFYPALVLILIGYLLLRHRYLLYLVALAVPVKVSLQRSGFKPEHSFSEIHENLIRGFSESGRGLQILDISTGTCNSLFRHGWMRLDAEYTGLDFSGTMIMQGLAFMTKKQVPIDFVLADALRLPFRAETFDIVLNYGAVNGFSSPGTALAEMARVTKRGGLMLFLDEQLYPEASSVERLYFSRVLSSHNVVHMCPVELLPRDVEQIQVYQVYQFYYLCTCFKT